MAQTETHSPTSSLERSQMRSTSTCSKMLFSPSAVGSRPGGALEELGVGEALRPLSGRA